MARFLTLVICLILAMPAGAASEQRRGSGLRELAAELADRLGEDSVQLRTAGRAVALERVGTRRNAPAVLFPSRIDPVELVEAMNRERAKSGLPAFRIDDRLCRAAEDRLREMLEEEYFAHIAPDGSEPFEPVLERGYDFVSAGENLAVGFSSARMVVTAWMQSPGHRDNLLSNTFEDVGVAVSSDAPGDEMRGHLFVVLYGSE